jgi:hypothetical protein
VNCARLGVGRGQDSNEGFCTTDTAREDNPKLAECIRVDVRRKLRPAVTVRNQPVGNPMVCLDDT